MNTCYAKAVLYAYKNLTNVMDQIDELVEKKALASLSDLSPCLSQCEKILSYTNQKDVLITLKIVVDNILKKFSDEDLTFFSYKYFKDKPKEFFVNFDYTGRAYFRRQVKLAIAFSDKLEKAGIDDKWFEENCLQMDFFKELLKRVIEHEENNAFKNNKTKPITKKQKNVVFYIA